MKFGNLDSPVTIDNTQKVIYDSGELGSAVTSITISGLNGDVDGEYELICRFIDDDTTGGYYLRFNNDSGNNYGFQSVYGSNATVGALRDTSEAKIDVGYTNTDGNISFDIIKIKAKSGYIRTVISKTAQDISGTTVTNAGVMGQVWNNTADNITSMVIGANADKMNIGSRIILLKKVTATDGVKTGDLEVQGKIYGVWQEVYNSTLTGTASSVTISGLTGDTDVLYRLRARWVNKIAGQVYCLINNDSTEGNYGWQDLNGSNTTASALRDTSVDKIEYFSYLPNIGDVGITDFLLYAKSGYIRTGMFTRLDGIATTTITGVDLRGHSYEDDNSNNDQITSLVFSHTETNGIDAGTSIVLERLNL